MSNRHELAQAYVQRAERMLNKVHKLVKWSGLTTILLVACIITLTLLKKPQLLPLPAFLLLLAIGTLGYSFFILLEVKELLQTAQTACIETSLSNRYGNLLPKM
jgi:hypothetical protein